MRDMKRCAVLKAMALGMIVCALCGCDKGPSCKEMLDRWCEQACRCGGPSYHCASGHAGDEFPLGWATKSECVGFFTFFGGCNAMEESDIEDCYDDLKQVNCVQFADDRWGLDVPLTCEDPG